MRVRWLWVRRSALLVLGTTACVACGGANGGTTLTGRLPETTTAPASTIAPGSEPGLAPWDSDIAPITSSTRVDPTKEFDALVERRIECGRSPRTCDVGALAVPGSPTHRRLEELFANRRASGIVASGEGKFAYRVDGVEETDDGAFEVSVCVTDDTVLVDENGWVFDDGLFSGHMVFTMREVDGEWLWFDDRTTTYTYGEDTCGLVS